MAIVALGDIDVETTVDVSGEASASETFTQTANSTYTVDTSTSTFLTDETTVSEDNAVQDTSITVPGDVFYHIEASFTINVNQDAGGDRDDQWELRANWDGTAHILASGTVQANAGGSDTDTATVNTITRADNIEAYLNHTATDSSAEMSLTVYEGQDTAVNIDSITQS